MLPLHAMGWDKDEFPEPERFIPERFSLDKKTHDDTKRHVCTFIPFSAGPRNCIGELYKGVLIQIQMKN